MFAMAQARMRGVKIDDKKDVRMRELMEEDSKRGMMALPADALRNQVRRSDPNMTAERIAKFIDGVEQLKRADPLAVLQEGTFDGGEEGGLLNMYKLSPNFELAMYLAQAIGGSIVTDSLLRWEEIQRTIRWRPPRPSLVLEPLSKAVATADFAFPQEIDDILNLDAEGVCRAYAPVLNDAFRYTSRIVQTGEKPNVEAGIAARFTRANKAAQSSLNKRKIETASGRVNCAFPWGGFQDNNVNRLLLMSSSEHHLPSVPMAFYISRPPNEALASIEPKRRSA